MCSIIAYELHEERSVARIDGWMDGWMNGVFFKYLQCFVFLIIFHRLILKICKHQATKLIRLNIQISLSQSEQKKHPINLCTFFAYVPGGISQKPNR
ncbi:hypothetical protein T01_1778 [Trichinella spiralis]|uniref:Uncharacterized protein n=1 Tax=Trichinella spiralis TaxID=6334 RepID=A0A0V1BRI6_TRISP|nr:hypothetical protein T01_1778 [Trichinella spiralis]